MQKKLLRNSMRDLRKVGQVCCSCSGPRGGGSSLRDFAAQPQPGLSLRLRNPFIGRSHRTLAFSIWGSNVPFALSSTRSDPDWPHSDTLKVRAFGLITALLMEGLNYFPTLSKGWSGAARKLLSQATPPPSGPPMLQHRQFQSCHGPPQTQWRWGGLRAWLGRVA